MRITTANSFATAVDNLQQRQQDLQLAQDRLTSGKRVARASDDPAAAARIHPNDPQRIQRALEIHALSGQTMTELLAAGQTAGLAYRLLKLVRAPADRTILHARIEQRFRAMLELGLVGEVESLWNRGDLTPDLPSMRCVGYRQVLSYLLGEYGEDEMRYRAVVATRQLAKRQMTWLRAEASCRWLADDDAALDEALRAIGAARSFP